MTSSDGAPMGDDGADGPKTIPSDGAPMGVANGEPAGALSSVWFAPPDGTELPRLASSDGAPTGDDGAPTGDDGAEGPKSTPSNGAPVGDAIGEPVGVPSPV